MCYCAFVLCTIYLYSISGSSVTIIMYIVYLKYLSYVFIRSSGSTNALWRPNAIRPTGGSHSLGRPNFSGNSGRSLLSAGRFNGGIPLRRRRCGVANCDIAVCRSRFFFSSAALSAFSSSRLKSWL
jgi:hypothetical protein